MKIKYIFSQAFAYSLSLVALSLSAQAQTKKLPKKEHNHILIAADNTTTGDVKVETLSGINLIASRNGSFHLDFAQDLKEDAILKISNEAGKIVYQKPVSIAGNKKSWRYEVGKLQPSIYLIEIKTSDTTYWTKFKVGK